MVAHLPPLAEFLPVCCCRASNPRWIHQSGSRNIGESNHDQVHRRILRGRMRSHPHGFWPHGQSACNSPPHIRTAKKRSTFFLSLATRLGAHSVLRTFAIRREEAIYFRAIWSFGRSSLRSSSHSLSFLHIFLSFFLSFARLAHSRSLSSTALC